MGISSRLRRALRGAEPPAVPAAERAPGWWDLLPFTTHRMQLAPGVWTLPDDRTPPMDDARTMLVAQCLGGSFEGRSIVDLGSNEGGFTLAFAQLGAARSVGIEARSLNVRRAELARSLLGLDPEQGGTAELVLGDVKTELARLGEFDVVFASGILYHVSDPADLLAAMRRACTLVAVIDTHVADPEVVTHGCSDLVTMQSDAAPPGSAGYRGRHFAEYDAGAGEREREELLWAAWNDAAAFWPLEDDLVRMLHDAGFARVGRIDPELVTGRHWAVDPTNRVLYLAWV
jgi:SAM-dependent methyltransferase